MTNLVPHNNVDRIQSDDNSLPNLGDWFFIKDEDGTHFVCVNHIGSNYVNVRGIDSPHGYVSARVHFNEIDEVLTHVADPKSYIQSQIDHYREKVSCLLGEVKRITAALGIQLLDQIEHQPQSSTTKDLVCLSGQDNIEKYKADLRKAQKEDLPELFKQIEKSNKFMAAWMSAESIAMKAMTASMQGAIGIIDERIFKVSLYAGLTESTVHCKEGGPASMSDKLHIMQRKLYMDEECLLGYRHGGMEFKDISAFDRWLSEKDNFNRILPFPRTIVAMQVRRREKDRKEDGTLHTALINFHLGELDKQTFLYIRNGENLYRLNTDIDFGEFIFPNKEEFDLTAPMMLNTRMRGNGQIITVHDYEERIKDREKQKALAEQWEKDHQKKDSHRRISGYSFDNPHGDYDYNFRPEHWELFSPESVFYDDTLKGIHKRANQYNRIVLIIQGLFDRSMVLHPHPPVKTWDQASFEQHIELHYDGSQSLYGALERPNFEAYFKKLNAQLTKDSYTIGQDDFWGAKEAQKEKDRRARSYSYSRSNYDWDYGYYQPYGNPGPGCVAKPVKLGSKFATYVWDRKRLRYSEYGDNGDIKTSIQVPKGLLFNVSAYKPGDYLQFFEDPRTRQEYLKWAPMLLEAEEFHAKKGTLK